MTTNILEHFALETPRPAQIDTLEWIANNVNKKYIFCELPVGSGKSAIAVTLANFLGTESNKSSFILTPQKILQTQYERSFTRKDDDRYFKSLYGKSNYRCQGKGVTCDIGQIITPKCGQCPHSAAINAATKANHVVLNYALAVRSFKHTEVFSRRKLLIMDECHKLEDVLTDYNNLTILKAVCEKQHIKWNVTSSVLNTFNWITNIYLPSMENALKQLDDECEPLLEDDHSRTPSDIIKLKSYMQMQDHIELLKEFTSQTIEEVNEKYILNVDDTQLKFKFLFGAENFHSILEPMAEKFLFLSATIFDHKEFCKNLNIPVSQACFITMPSDFDVDNRPVIYSPVMKMNYNWNDPKFANKRKEFIEMMISVIMEHKEHKGIIHTGNFAIAQWLVKELHKVPHVIMHHNPGSGNKRDEVIDNFMNHRKPAILVSPSITEGLDLVDDKARFAIFAKVPFGTLTDSWVKARMDLSQKWYLLRAMTDVIQGCGRIVRSPDDYGNVYILDESFQYLYDRTKQYVPTWWKDAFHKL